MRGRLLTATVVLLALGCGSNKFAPVSGTVTLNGQPLANASVSFQPVAPGGTVEAGVGSSGKTGPNGEFTLVSSTGQTGAVVGQHRVRISALEKQAGETDARPPRGGWPMKDKVPAKYNNKSELTVDVPSGGTPNANFELRSR